MATTHQQQQLDAEISVLPNIETLDPPSTTGTNPEPPVSMLLDGPSLWPEAPPQYTPNDPLRNCKPPAYVADGSDVEDGARRHREKRMKLIFIGLAVVLVVVFVAAMAGGMVAGRKNASKMADRKNASNKVDSPAAVVSNVDKIVTKDEFPVLPLGIFKVQKTLSGNDSLCVGNGHLWNCNGYSGMDSSVPHYSSTNGDFLLEISTPSFGQNNYKYGGGSPYQISSVGNHPDYPYQPSMTNASLVYTLDQGYQFDFKVVTLTYTRDVGSVTGGSGVQQAGSVDPYSTRGGLGLAFPWLGAQANIMRCMWSGMSFKGTISGALAKLAVNPGTSAKSVKNSTAAIDSPKELVPLWPGNFFIQLVREETDITYCRNVFFNSTSPFDKNVVGVMDYGSVWEHDDSFQEIQGNGCMCGWGEGQA